jgi:putative ABC transport system permease protein
LSTIYKAAARNVKRNRRRTIIAFVAISFGLAGSIVTVSINKGFESQALSNSVSTKTGHVKIFADGYYEERDFAPLDFLIEDGEEVIRAIETVDGVNAVAPKIVFRATITDGLQQILLLGAGIDPRREDRVFALGSKIVKGEYVADDEERILLSAEVAELLGAEIGEEFTVMARTRHGAISALDLPVGGVYHVGNPEIDNLYFFVPLTIVSDVLEMEEAVTEIAVMGGDLNSASKLAARIRSKVAGIGSLRVLTWSDLTEDLQRFFTLRRKARSIITFIFIGIAAAGIANTMLMATYERTREIGLLLALGMSRLNVVKMFIAEAAVIGLLGSLLGCMIGAGVSFYYEAIGIDVSFASSTGSTFPIPSTLYADFTLVTLLGNFLLGVVVAMIAGIYPAVRASRLQPASALRWH